MQHLWAFLLHVTACRKPWQRLGKAERRCYHNGCSVREWQNAGVLCVCRKERQEDLS